MEPWKEFAQLADNFTDIENIRGAYEILQKANETGVHHPQLSWRYARALYKLAEETTDKNVREQHFNEGFNWAKKAVEEDPNFYATHKWFGILLSSQGEFVSTKEKIANAYVIRDNFLKALELKKDDTTLHHCMGMWCWNVLQINWVERKVASVLFGEPPTSTYDECLKYLLAADAIEPFPQNTLAIGNVYLQQKKKDEAKIWFEKVINSPAPTEATKRLREEALQKIALC